MFYLFFHQQSLKATKNLSTSEWCKKFEITFQNEDGKLQTFLLRINIFNDYLKGRNHFERLF